MCAFSVAACAARVSNAGSEDLPTNEIAKNHYSHMGDGVQYLCLGFHFPTMTGPRKVRARPVVPRKYHYV